MPPNPSALPSSQPQSSQKVDAETADRRTILIVEDDAISAQAMRILLRRSGWLVEVAPTIADANAYLDRNTPHTIILDLMLPDGDGSLVLRRVRDQALKTRVTVTTATADAGWIDRVKALNPHAILRKPIELTELMNALSC
ncbi:response regulator transcription factor [Humisphaera borealis]|uniref:Response regulator n=1 Tax=Humisphaera borealis TaxID=2807512 RepID=A0A7M2WUD7_9BACT|nr:response regulator [Humisphaera borealis]QOV89118.1 response regulator [Humisphaera borealis]